MKFINKRKSHFTTLPNDLILDPSLSWKAKGILAYLLSRPPDWQFYEAEILRHAIDGKDSLKAGIKELITVGYVRRFRNHDDKGRFSGYEYHVYENPQESPPKTADLSIVGKSVNGLSAPTNTDLTNDQKQQFYDDLARKQADDDWWAEGQAKMLNDVANEGTKH